MSASRLFFSFIVILCAVAAFNVQSTDIFKCQDERGRAVFSSTPCPDSAVTGNDDAAQLWRTMRGQVKQGLGILNELSGDLDSIQRCKHDMARFKDSVLSLEKRVNALEEKHKSLVRAHQQLLDCAQCRVSAASFCKRADQYLDEAMNELIELKFER